MPVPGEGSGHIMPEHDDLMTSNALFLGAPIVVDITYVEAIAINIGKCHGAEAA